MSDKKFDKWLSELDEFISEMKRTQNGDRYLFIMEDYYG